jgi:hypothetical protein
VHTFAGIGVHFGQGSHESRSVQLALVFNGPLHSEINMQDAQGLVKWECAEWIWASRALLKCRIFAWLALQFRLWTSERRYRHELDDSVSPCYTCLQDFDSASHIFVECVHARQVWFGCLVALGIDIAAPTVHDSLQEWWKAARGRFRKKEKQGFDALVILITWRLWKQRNARVFNNPRKQFLVQGLVDQVLAEWTQWSVAGLGGCNRFQRVVH